MGNQNNITDNIARDAWLLDRRKGIGSSDAPILMNVAPEAWGSWYSLWANKVQGTDMVERTEAMWWGSILEPVIANQITARWGGRIVDKGPYHIDQHAKYPWMLACVDRLYTPKGSYYERILELKTANQFRAGDWSDGVPARNRVQVQHQMEVTGIKVATVACLIGGQVLETFEEEYDKEFCEAMIEVEQAFWKCVEENKPPHVDGSIATRKVIDLLHPKDDGSVVALPVESLRMDARLSALKADIKAFKSEQAEIENWFREKIGDATKGVFQDVKFTLKAQTRRRSLKIDLGYPSEVGYTSHVEDFLDGQKIPYKITEQTTFRTLLRKKK